MSDKEKVKPYSYENYILDKHINGGSGFQGTPMLTTTHAGCVSECRQDQNDVNIIPQKKALLNALSDALERGLSLY